MAFHAGLDWSGAPDAPTDETIAELYIPCLAVTDDVTLNAFLSTVRVELGFSDEFHGYRLRKRSDILLRIVQFAIDHANVSAIVFEKGSLMTGYGAGVFDKPELLAPATGLLVAHHGFQFGEMSAITYDKPDIAGDQRRKAFRTAVQRKAKILGLVSPLVRPADSKLSQQVQFADVIAYLLRREESNLSETIELGKKVRKLMRWSENYISTGEANDLRPYLSL